MECGRTSSVRWFTLVDSLGLHGIAAFSDIKPSGLKEMRNLDTARIHPGVPDQNNPGIPITEDTRSTTCPFVVASTTGGVWAQKKPRGPGLFVRLASCPRRSASCCRRPAYPGNCRIVSSASGATHPGRPLPGLRYRTVCGRPSGRNCFPFASRGDKRFRPACPRSRRCRPLPYQALRGRRDRPQSSSMTRRVRRHQQLPATPLLLVLRLPMLLRLPQVPQGLTMHRHRGKS